MKRLRLKGALVGADVFVALVRVGEKGGEGRRNGGRLPAARRRLSAQPLLQVVQLLLNCLLLQGWALLNNNNDCSSTVCSCKGGHYRIKMTAPQLSAPARVGTIE